MLHLNIVRAQSNAQWINAPLFNQWYLFYFIITDLHLIGTIPYRGDLTASFYSWMYHLNRVTLTFFIKFLFSAYTVYQHTKPQLFLCCPSQTLADVFASNSDQELARTNDNLVMQGLYGSIITCDAVCCGSLSTVLSKSVIVWSVSIPWLLRF